MFGVTNTMASIKPADPNFMHIKEKSEGNIRSILNFLASQSNDKIILTHLKQVQETFAANPNSQQVTFLSTTFVHIVIKCIKQYILTEIRNTIMNECNEIFAIQIDTSKDRTCKNQCALVIRYATSDFKVYNRVIALWPIFGQSTGSKLFEFAKTKLEEMELKDLKKCVASCTDGASNMHSDSVGFSAFLARENPSHVYTWCVSHRYNLVVEPIISSTDNLVTCIFDTLHSFATILRGSSIRIEKWTATLNGLREEYKDINVLMKPVLAGDTRWWTKYRAIERLMKKESYYMSHLLTLRELSKLKLAHTQKNTVESALKTLLNYDNIVIAYFVNIIMCRLYQDVATLQTSALPIVNIMPIIKSTTTFLKRFIGRNDIYLKTLSDAQKFVTSLNSRLVDRNPNDLKINVTRHNESRVFQIVQRLISTLIDNFNSRFLADLEDAQRKAFFDQMSTMHPKNVKSIVERSDIDLSLICSMSGGINELETLSEMNNFAIAFNEFILNQETIGGVNNNRDDIEDEWKSFEQYLSTRKNEYEKVVKLYQYIYTLPSSQVDCERCFSTMKHIKTPARSQMSDETLDSCVIIKLSSDLVPRSAHSEIIDRVAKSSKKLKNLLMQNNLSK